MSCKLDFQVKCNCVEVINQKKLDESQRKMLQQRKKEILKEKKIEMKGESIRMVHLQQCNNHLKLMGTNALDNLRSTNNLT